MDEKQEIFENGTWAVVEMMGRQIVAGQITEVTIAGTAMLRIDVPGLPGNTNEEAIPPYTKFVAGGALYAITPTDEASARHVVAAMRVRPIATYTIPRHVLAAYHDDEEEGI